MRLISILISFSLLISTAIADEHRPWNTSLLGDYKHLKRTAYTVDYASKYRIPLLVSYHAIPEYRKIAKRESKFKSFNTDPDIANAVNTSEYTHSGYARGHMVPYFISGGDRDGDGKYAIYKDSNSDKDDEKTIFEINYMSNITPQHHNCFNGAGGVWYKLESFVRKKLLDSKKKELWIYAGAIIDNVTDDDSWTGKNKDIAVPDRFFKIIVERHADGKLTALPFLFPHYRKVNGECNDEERKFYDSTHLTTVDQIERITGIHFFPMMSDVADSELEGRNGVDVWNKYYVGNI